MTGSAVAGEGHVATVHRRIERGEVGALVRAAALLAGQRGPGDQPHQRMLVVQQRAQPGGVTLEPRVLPERGAGRG